MKQRSPWKVIPTKSVKVVNPSAKVTPTQMRWAKKISGTARRAVGGVK